MLPHETSKLQLLLILVDSVYILHYVTHGTGLIYVTAVVRNGDRMHRLKAFSQT